MDQARLRRGPRRGGRVQRDRGARWPICARLRHRRLTHRAAFFHAATSTQRTTWKCSKENRQWDVRDLVSRNYEGAGQPCPSIPVGLIILFELSLGGMSVVCGTARQKARRRRRRPIKMRKQPAVGDNHQIDIMKSRPQTACMPRQRF